jgi:hypothetical protein
MVRRAFLRVALRADLVLAMSLSLTTASAADNAAEATGLCKKL